MNIHVSGAAGKALGIGLATVGLGAGVWAVSRALANKSEQAGAEQNGSGDSQPAAAGTQEPHESRSLAPMSGNGPGDSGGSYFPTNPGNGPGDSGGGWLPADPGNGPGDGFPYDPGFPFDPSFPSFPSYPSQSMHRAVASVAPYTWSSADIDTVIQAATSAGRSTRQAADMVNEVYQATPYSWSSGQEARVAATGLATRTSARETGRVISEVRWATPSHWSPNSDVRLAIAALRGGVHSSDTSTVIRNASAYGASELVAVARAESMLLGGGYGSSRPDYPYVPGFPELPGFPGFPTFPTLPTLPDSGIPPFPEYDYPDPDSGWGGNGPGDGH